MSDEMEEKDQVKAEETPIGIIENMSECSDPHTAIEDAIKAQAVLTNVFELKLAELTRLTQYSDKLEYEVEMLRVRNEDMKNLLIELRKRLFWQNNMDLVKLIDQNGGL